MDSHSQHGSCLLESHEPPPFVIERAGGASPYLLVCEHAGKRIPARLGDLGLAPRDLERHIAWDIGACAVARKLSARLDATLVTQTYSRLVIDCNRQAASPGAIVTKSEDTVIPGNSDLSAPAIEARIREIHRPYQDAVASLLDRRERSILIDVHSFTPRFLGVERPWHVGLLHGIHDRLFTDLLLGYIRDEEGLVAGDNEPYMVDMENDYTIPLHGIGRGIVNMEFEMRQDLIGHEPGQEAWAARLEGWLNAALPHLPTTP